MGLSASQARLLSLTARLSDLELKAQTVSNAKIRLSDMADQASTDYSKALDKQSMKVYTGLQNDGTSSYKEATAANLTTYNAISTTDKQRFIKDSSGQMIVSGAIADNYKASKGDLEKFLNVLGYTQFPNEDRASSIKNTVLNDITTEKQTILNSISIKDVQETSTKTVNISICDPAVDANVTLLEQSWNNLGTGLMLQRQIIILRLNLRTFLRLIKVLPIIQVLSIK